MFSAIKTKKPLMVMMSARINASTSLGSIRTLIVPYNGSSRKALRFHQGSMPALPFRRRRAGAGAATPTFPIKVLRKPTTDIAKAMPLSPQEMDNDSLVTIGALGFHPARKEIVKRHIMATDNCSYEAAEAVFAKIEAKNQELMSLLSLPYQIGIVTALTAGFASLPLVFDLPTVEWFNHHFVTTDVPEPQDLETMLEVGSWAWNWMEPPLGTISFFLLTLQFSRSQMQNLGVKPYTEKVKRLRGIRLAQAFPQYDASVLISFSESSTIIH